MNIVIGSGPAGVAAARALLEKGQTVTLLDAGRTLPAENARSLKTLRSLPRDRWPAEDLKVLRGSPRSTRRGVELKTTYGSDFAYRPLSEVDRLPSSILIRASHALGGLSNVWGGAVLPVHARDIDGWPFSIDTLRPHYEKILSWLDLSASEDGLAKVFPLYSKSVAELKSSRQAEAFLSNASTHRNALEGHGIYVGRSRLAVRAKTDERGSGCVYCGACLTGCPYELIFNSASWIDQWKGQLRFSYRPGVVVERIKETDRGVEITVRDEAGRESLVSGDRAFLAAGFLSTAKIILSSIGLYETELQVRASQYFIFPFLTRFLISDVRKENLHTLSQFFISVLNSNVSPRTVSLQGYTYNPFLGDYIDRRLGPLAKVFRPLTDRWLGRLFIFQAYLHSDESPQLGMTLVKTEQGDRLRFRRIENPRTRPAVKNLMRLLSENRVDLGGSALRWMLALGKIGDGSHLGGCFPMRKNPGPLESDELGRPAGLRRVHAVDSSVFPSIPASTITLSVMANAHRIAASAGEL